MKKFITVLVIIIVLAILVFAAGPFYVLNEGEQAVITRFGAIVATNREAGLRLKMPVVDNVVKYSKKIITWDGMAQRIPTQENQFIWVDATARWKIVDPLKFYESVTTMEAAYSRLDDIIDSSVRTVISDNPLAEAVRNSNVINEIQRAVTQGQGEEESSMREISGVAFTQINYDTINKGRLILSDEIYKRAATITPQFGIELTDIIIRQIRYSDDLTESVYNRMIKERNQVAEFYRSYGQGQKQEWLGKLDNEQRAILSRAYETAEEIKGKADATATRIYADAYEADPEFFEFWRSIESYRKILPQFRKTLTTDMEYFKYLYSQVGD
ncbi:MAG: protease modulator HflC [Spirochaetales bacterium]|nr:protease modulator HflC [Spirochaetales bacterium]